MLPPGSILMNDLQWHLPLDRPSWRSISISVAAEVVIETVIGWRAFPINGWQS